MQRKRQQESWSPEELKLISRLERADRAKAAQEREEHEKVDSRKKITLPKLKFMEWTG